MDRKKIELIITVCLVVILALVFTTNLRKVRQKMPATKGQTLAAPPHKIEPLFPARKEEKKMGPGEAEELSWGRDPFTLQEITSADVNSVENLKLMGITVGKGTRPIAIINNEMVSAGSKIGKFTVVNILPDKVVVTDGEKNYDLVMK